MNTEKLKSSLKRTSIRFFKKCLDTQKYIAQEDRPFAIAAILLGFLNHFLYQLSGKAAFIALFCPINESVWEHLKLVFFPILFVSVLEYLRYRPEPVRFFYYRFLDALCAMAATVALFYTYTGMTGRDFFFMDISIFLFSILFAFGMDAYFYRKSMQNTSQATTFSLWIVMSMCYFVFTCFPPDIPLFFSITY